ncbi:hypothetical protein DFQ28_005408 [Apophysomyces sp. BC1034]|nr:hypothetical protein DFQ28_005408 [Apophysomyces sp. BC1034]
MSTSHFQTQFSPGQSSAHWESLLDPNEKQAYVELFRTADTDGKGILLKDEAMSFFKRSDVPANILTEIWDASDNDNKGFLTDMEFCIALKLIACAQHGILTASPVLSTSVPLPQFSGVSIKPLPPNRANTVTSTPSDIITPDERSKYIGIFQSSGPIDGLLSGDKAKNIFLRSSLSPEALHSIWSLADTRKSGMLNQTEFIIAMHYIAAMMKGALQSLPSTLPAHIYAAATGRTIGRQYAGNSPVMRNMTGSSAGTPATRHATGPSTVFTGDQSHHAGRGDLDISADELVKYKAFFEQLNTNGSGYVSGSDAVHFFRHSKLPEPDLARIWDLADINGTGQLSQEEFSIAMHLINKRMAGGQIPASLPNLQQGLRAAPQQPVDLLGLGDNSADFPASAVGGPQTGHAEADLQQERSVLENELSLIRSDTRSQSERVQNLQSQYEVEMQAIRELQENITKEKEVLENLKRTADEAERNLENERKNKEELTQELQMYRQESRHFKQRAENAQREADEIRSDIETQKKPADMNSANDFFALSNVPSSELFASVAEVPKASSESALSPSLSVSSARTNRTFDPFAGIKNSDNKASSLPSSPSVTLNRLKEAAAEQKQSRSSTPNVDISEVEAKFPDLSTMEQNFSATSPTSVSFAPQETQQDPAKPDHTEAFAPPTHSLASPFPTSPVTSKQQQLFSPPQIKSVSKYGFDLSAFEGPSSTTDASASSVKDDLSAIFGNTQPEKRKEENTPVKQDFDDIFNVTPQPKKEPSSFTDIFLP